LQHYDDEEAKEIKIKQALQIIMLDWNKQDTNLQLIHTEFDTTRISKKKYQNLVSDLLGEINWHIIMVPTLRSKFSVPVLALLSPKPKEGHVCAYVLKSSLSMP
jgi:hypothetical protein